MSIVSKIASLMKNHEDYLLRRAFNSIASNEKQKQKMMADHYESSACHIDEMLIKLAASADTSAVFHTSECQCRGTMRSYTVRSNIKWWRIYGVGDGDPEITAQVERTRAHTCRGTSEGKEEIRRVENTDG